MELVPPTNKHHLRFERAHWVYQEFSRKVRQHPGMILHNVSIEEHRGLHKEVQGIRPVTKTLAIISLSHLMSMNTQDARQAAVPHADFLAYIGEDDTKLGEEARAHADHLNQQIDYFNLRT